VTSKTSPTPPTGEDLLSRKGLPDDLRVLLARYPRDTWEGHHNLGELAQFWLGRHGMFRELGAGLADGAVAFRESKIEAEPFFGWLAPRFNFFLGELHTHHMVEDEHYFPRFRAADARLARGFDILDADHVAIDRYIHALAEAGGSLDAALKGSGDLPGASAMLAERLAATLGVLLRHLDDEEDLIEPLILERSERGLGVA